jgi:serine/threonine protein kinase
MIALLGYQILAQIYESPNSLVYRGIREEDNQPVILKFMKDDYPTPEQIIRYKQEYKITHNLNLQGVVQAYSLEKYQNSLVIIFEDFGGESLNILMNNKTFTLKEFLFIAIKTSKILSEIHRRHIIHKDLNPSNIVFNPNTKNLKLIDFGISSILSRENPTLKNPNVLEGTLAYISPEQTGSVREAAKLFEEVLSLNPEDKVAQIYLYRCQGIKSLSSTAYTSTKESHSPSDRFSFLIKSLMTAADMPDTPPPKTG